MALMMLTQRLPAGEPQLLERAEYVDALVDRTIEAVHRISLDLRPSMLDFGLVAALEWQSREFEKQNGISVAFSSSAKEIDLSLDHATALFRIFQEALTNIAKHARATQVTVRLQALKRQIKLTIADNGVGIAQADRMKPQSFGLRGMSERAKALGGTMALSASPNGGATLTIKVKLSSARPAIMETAIRHDIERHHD
jgi:two-component system sensor histidine kinase UhpB